MVKSPSCISVPDRVCLPMGRVFPVATVLPWNSQLMLGAGVPTAWQVNSTDALSETAVGSRRRVMTGTTAVVQKSVSRNS